MSGISLDDQRFPVLVTRIEGEITPQGLRDYAEAMKKVLSRDQRFVSLADGVKAMMPSGELRSEISNYLRDVREDSERLCIAFGVVLESPFVKTVLNSLFLLARSRMRIEVFNSLDEAIAWAEEEIELDSGKAD